MQPAVYAGARCAVDRGIAITVGVAVLDPLPDISEHVIESESVWLKAADRGGRQIAVVAWQHRPFRMGLLCGLVGAVAKAAKVIVLVAKVIARCASCARRVFPLSLGQQPVGLPGFARQPGHVSLGVVPVEAYCRMRRVLQVTGIAP